MANTYMITWSVAMLTCTYVIHDHVAGRMFAGTFLRYRITRLVAMLTGTFAWLVARLTGTPYIYGR